MTERSIAVYARVSSRRQDTKSQEPDLERWVSAFADGRPVRWYRDKASGKTMDRPGWNKLEADMTAGLIGTLLCWRMDRLGRSCSALVALFEQLAARKINLVAMRDGFDLGTPSGRMVAHILASIAQFENEVRAERIIAGQAVARANGKQLGGSKRGRRIWISEAQVELVLRLKSEDVPITKIAESVGVNRSTVYTLLRNANEEQPA